MMDAAIAREGLENIRADIKQVFVSTYGSPKGCVFYEYSGRRGPTTTNFGVNAHSRLNRGTIFAANKLTAIL